MTTAVAEGPPTEGQRTDSVRNEEVRGRAVGIVVCAVMGLAWAASTLGVLSVVVAVPVLTASVGVAVTLIAGAHRLRRTLAAGPALASPSADFGNFRRRFNLIALAEFAAIAAAINGLSWLGYSQWIPAAICGVVGLHFLPLARLFRVGLYYATAAALCLAAGATMVLGAAGAPASLWRLLPGFGAALALWATGARLLVTTVTPRLPLAIQHER